MKKLLQQYKVNNVQDYRTMVLDKFQNATTNSEREESKRLFMAMPKKERVEFLKDMIFYYASKPAMGSIYFFNAIFAL